MKRKIKPCLRFGSYPTAWLTIQGNETMHLIRKGQIEGASREKPRGLNQFIAEQYGLAM